MAAEPVPELTFIAVGRIADQPVASYCHDPGEGKDDQYGDIFAKILGAAAQKMKPGARQRLQWGEGSICCVVDPQGHMLYCVYTSSLTYPENLAYDLLSDVMAAVVSDPNYSRAEGDIDTVALKRKMKELVCKYEDPQNPDLQHEAPARQSKISISRATDRDFGATGQRRSGFGLPQIVIAVVIVAAVIGIVVYLRSRGSESETESKNEGQAVSSMLQDLTHQVVANRGQHLRGNDSLLA
jgi:hypothetical protein